MWGRVVVYVLGVVFSLGRGLLGLVVILISLGLIIWGVCFWGIILGSSYGDIVRLWLCWGIGS